MIKDDWNIIGLWQTYYAIPYENQDVKKISWGGL